MAYRRSGSVCVKAALGCRRSQYLSVRSQLPVISMFSSCTHATCRTGASCAATCAAAAAAAAEANGAGGDSACGGPYQVRVRLQQRARAPHLHARHAGFGAVRLAAGCHVQPETAATEGRSKNETQRFSVSQ